MSEKIQTARGHSVFVIPFVKDQLADWTDKFLDSCKINDYDRILCGSEKEPHWIAKRYFGLPPPEEISSEVAFTTDSKTGLRILSKDVPVTAAMVADYPSLMPGTGTRKDELVKNEAAILWKQEWRDYSLRRIALFSCIVKCLGTEYEYVIRSETTGTRDPQKAWELIQAEFFGKTSVDAAMLLSEYLAIRSLPDEPLPLLLDRIALKKSQLDKAGKSPDAAIHTLVLKVALGETWYETNRIFLINHRNATVEEQIQNLREEHRLKETESILRSPSAMYAQANYSASAASAALSLDNTATRERKTTYIGQAGRSGKTHDNKCWGGCGHPRHKRGMSECPTVIKDKTEGRCLNCHTAGHLHTECPEPPSEHRAFLLRTGRDFGIKVTRVRSYKQHARAAEEQYDPQLHDVEVEVFVADDESDNDNTEAKGDSGSWTSYEPSFATETSTVKAKSQPDCGFKHHNAYGLKADGSVGLLGQINKSLCGFAFPRNAAVCSQLLLQPSFLTTTTKNLASYAIDSACGKTSSYEASDLIGPVRASPVKALIAAGGHLLPVSGQASNALFGGIETQLCPTLTKKLLSVSQVNDGASGKPAVTLFTSNAAVTVTRNDAVNQAVETLMTAPRLVTGERRGNLYYTTSTPLALDESHRNKHVQPDNSCLTADSLALATDVVSLSECFIEPVLNTADLLHFRMCHVPYRVLKYVSSNGIVTGLETLMKRHDASKCTDSLCHPCAISKSVRKKKPRFTKHARTLQYLQVVHSDLSGPLPHRSIQGNWYSNNFVDYATGLMTIFFQPNKTASSEITSLTKFQAQRGTMKTWRTDNGGENLNQLCFDYCVARGIIHQTTSPYSPFQNGIVERPWQTIYNIVRTMLKSAHLHPKYWQFAAQYAVYVLNRLPNTGIDKGKTSHELALGTVPDLSYCRVFGCTAFALIDPPTAGKLSDKAIKGVFVGLKESAAEGTYLIYVPSTGRTIVTRNATFDEGSILKLNGLTMPEDFIELPEELPDDKQPVLVHKLTVSGLPSVAAKVESIASEAITPLSDDDDYPTRYVTTPAVPAVNVPLIPVALKSPLGYVPSPPPPESETVTLPPIDGVGHNQFMVQPEFDAVFEEAIEPDESRFAHGYNTRNRPLADALLTDSKLSSLLLLIDDDLIDSYCLVTNTEVTHLTDCDLMKLRLCQSLQDCNPYIDAMELDVNNVYAVGEDMVPKDYKAAVDPLNPDCDNWKKSIKEEYNSHIERGTWREVNRDPEMRLLEPKWVFKIKRNVDGTIARYKSRLVIKGYRQIRHMHYDPNDLYSPVLRNPTLRVMLAAAAEFGLDLRQLDVMTAFLYGVLPIDSKLFMSVPDGYKKHCGSILVQPVLKLLKAIYGLKQAPKVWSDTIKDFLVRLGYRVSDGDPCLFVKSSGVELTMVGVFVDDLLTGFRDIRHSQVLEAQLCKAFEMKIIGPANWFLGMHITRDPVTKQVSLSHELYISKLVATFWPSKDEVRTTPCLERTRYTSDQCPKTDDDKRAMAKRPYNRLLGALLYIAMTCRPDIAYCTGNLARFGKNPGEAHWNGLIDILKYLNTYPKLGLSFSRNNNARGPGPWLMPIAFSDSDWIKMEPDNALSVTGYCILMNGAAVVYASRKQSVIAASAHEAEYIALAALCADIKWIRMLLSVFDTTMGDRSVNVYADNLSMIQLANGPVVTPRSKAIHVRYHIARECVSLKIISLHSIPGEINTADIFTKPLGPDRHGKLVKQLMGPVIQGITMYN